MTDLMTWINQVNNIIWHDYVTYVILGFGVLFTLWSKFSQIVSLTHGVAVIRGKYDRKDDPGAINHFQALSAALSATVGLGNIGGVAIAISVGGPGAVLWMWVVGFVGMALKLTEVTQAMLYRNTSDPDNPSGGAMWVAQRGFTQISPALRPLGVAVGMIFCATLMVSTVTGGNMFQAWNVADIGHAYFKIPKEVTGILMTILVGMVIVGGIKRIGNVAGRLVPFMCALYILAALYVVLSNLDKVPEMFRLIWNGAFSGTQATGAFLGGTAGFAFTKGMQRALFSNEAGQGSAPIAHSAAKTDEPAREGVVAGLEPFIDTLLVCTLTALVILLSGTWNRQPAMEFVEQPSVIPWTDAGGKPVAGAWTLTPTAVKVRDEIEAAHQMNRDQDVVIILEAHANADTGQQRHKLNGKLAQGEDQQWRVSWGSFESQTKPTIAVDGVYFDFKGATLTAKAFDHVLPGLGFWIVPAAVFLFAISTIISWSYYGEQGIVYLFGRAAVMPYRLAYCGLIFVSCTQLIRTEAQLDTLSNLGTGVMLWANLPIMLIFGPKAMSAYHSYVGRLRRGEMKSHPAPPLVDVVEGRDVK